MGMQGNMMYNNSMPSNVQVIVVPASAMQQPAPDPCKAMFGMSQQEVGATAAVAGILLYPNIMNGLIKSNPQMQTKVSRFLGSGPANGF